MSVDCLLAVWVWSVISVLVGMMTGYAAYLLVIRVRQWREIRRQKERDRRVAWVLG